MLLRLPGIEVFLQYPKIAWSLLFPEVQLVNFMGVVFSGFQGS